MTRLRRDMSRGRLDRLLGAANDEPFFIMAWAVRAIQDDRAGHAKRLLTFPAEAATEEMTSPFAVHPWALETLINEKLVRGTEPIIDGRRNRRLDCGRFDAMAQVVNALKGLENAEDNLTLRRVPVRREMHRLAQRQFEWQRGFLNWPRYYRAGRLFGGPLTRAHFDQSRGLALDDFVLGGFALFAQFQETPGIFFGGAIPELGLSGDALSRTMQIVSLPLADARRMARKLRAATGHVAYKRSILRTTPAIGFGSPGEQVRIRAPLPDLLVQRCTSGLFYDVVGASGQVRNEISERFEAYGADMLKACYPTARVDRSYAYSVGKRRLDTPDILMRDADGTVDLLIECKATRMSYEATFSEDPIADARRGYEEIAKGVVQIWRFVAHRRLGLLDERDHGNTTGLVLTLDGWLTLSEELRADVLTLAGKLADKETEITQADRIPVAFAPVDDLEAAVLTGSERTFRMVVRTAAADPDYAGWDLSGIMKDRFPDQLEPRPHPFADKIGEVFDWWPRLEAEARRRGVPPPH